MHDAATQEQIHLVTLYLPSVTDEQVSKATVITEAIETHYQILKADFREITAAHAQVFHRLIQLDPCLRREPADQRNGVISEPLISPFKRPTKAEAKKHLATLHRHLDAYQVPAAERREFFKALTIHWYLAYSMLRDDIADVGKSSVQ